MAKNVKIRENHFSIFLHSRLTSDGENRDPSSPRKLPPLLVCEISAESVHKQKYIYTRRTLPHVVAYW